MNRWKKSLIVAAVFLGVGIIGSIVSGIYMAPRVINEIYRVQREVANADVSEREVFTTAEEIQSINIESLKEQGFDVEVVPSTDGNTRVKVNEYMENTMKVESTYNEEKKELTVVGERSIYNLFEGETLKGLFENGYDAVISTLVEERNDNSQIIIEVPKAVDINFQAHYYANLIVNDNAVLKDNLTLNSGNGYVSLPAYNTLKNITIKTNDYVEMDLRELINAENVNISARSIQVTSKGFEKEYIEAAKLPGSVILSGRNIEIKSYMPIGKDVKLDGDYINYQTNFRDYGMNVNIEGNSQNVYFHGEEFENQYDLSNFRGNYSGYIGRGENKDFNLKVSRFSNCEFQHVYPEELEKEVY